MCDHVLNMLKNIDFTKCSLWPYFGVAHHKSQDHTTSTQEGDTWLFHVQGTHYVSDCVATGSMHTLRPHWQWVGWTFLVRLPVPLNTVKKHELYQGRGRLHRACLKFVGVVQSDNQRCERKVHVTATSIASCQNSSNCLFLFWNFHLMFLITHLSVSQLMLSVILA